MDGDTEEEGTREEGIEGVGEEDPEKEKREAGFKEG
jgi:hypothetical protein